MNIRTWEFSEKVKYILPLLNPHIVNIFPILYPTLSLINLRVVSEQLDGKFISNTMYLFLIKMPTNI